MAKEWRLLDLYVDLNENSAFLNPAIQRARVEGLVPDTVTFCSIKKIGISLGFDPDPEKDINLDYCRTHDIGVSRRLQPYYVNIGYPGFFVAYIIVGKNFMPSTVAEIFKTVISQMAEEFNGRWGTAAQYRPFNDMEVGGRKISWMGGSFFGDVWRGASVLLVKPSPIDKINPALNIPLEKFADKDTKTAGERAVSLEELTGWTIPLDEVREAYRHSLEKIFGVNDEAWHGHGRADLPEARRGGVADVHVRVGERAHQPVDRGRLLHRAEHDLAAKSRTSSSGSRSSASSGARAEEPSRT